MSSTTTLFGPDLTKETVHMVINAATEGTLQATRLLWSILISILTTYWLSIMLSLFVVFVILTIKAMLGQWGSLGSFLYNLFYFGILLIVGLLMGPELFVNDFFAVACAVILYPLCYWLVGIILEKMGVKIRK